MDTIKNNIYELVDKELNAANEKFPLFASYHEAYAVIFEEFEETRDELNELESSVNRFWLGIKQNTSYIVEIDRLAEIYERAVRLAVEAIKTAAMARKGILSSYQKGDPAYGETTEN